MQSEKYHITEKFEPGIKKAETFGKWEVAKSGNMTYDGGRYLIAHDTLDEDDWFRQLYGKVWIDWSEFIPAYFQALTNKGIKVIKQKLDY